MSLRTLRPDGDELRGCLVVGEVAQAHDGSLGFAHAFVDAVADAGADAVKFQTHIAAAESTPSEPWRVPFSRQDETRYDYWKRMEFTEPQWRGLADHAVERGLLFLSSPFSLESVELLERVGMRAWKIASGELANPDLLDAVGATGKPVILSSGMSPWSELDAAVARVGAHGSEVAVLQCSSTYPAPPEETGLNVLGELRERYGCAVGISDHSATIYPGLAAVALGAEIVEVHVTLSRDMFGPDVCASLTPDELRDLVDGVRFIETAMAHPIDKDANAARMEPMRALFTRSLVADRDLPAGTTLERSMLALKKPGTGLPASRLDDVVGRRLARAVRTDQLLVDDDLEPGR